MKNNGSTSIQVTKVITPLSCMECNKPADYALINRDGLILLKLCKRDIRNLSNRMLMATVEKEASSI